MTEPRRISLSEVKKHATKKSLWLVIHNDVLDVTPFVNEHPGGAQLLLDYAGTDATFAFEDAGHSHDARELAQKFKIGWLPPEERMRFKDTCPDDLVDRVLCNKVPSSIRQANYPAYANPHNLYVTPRRPDSGKWKYALLLLAVVLIGGFAYKKFSK